MEKNVGGIDQVLRIVLGIAALGVAVASGLPTWAVFVLGVVGVIALVTGGLGFCPVWTLLGINTSCSLKDHNT